MFGSSKALQRQIMERDAQIAEITKELETYKMLEIGRASCRERV